MIYPKTIEEKLGFDQIKGLVKEKCLSDLGANRVDTVRFMIKPDQVLKLLMQTNEFLQIIKADLAFPAEHYIDVSASLKKAQTEGTFLLENEFLDISNSAKTILKTINFLTKNKEDYPKLFELTGLVQFDVTIPSAIDSKIDESGKVRDKASAELSTIRKSLNTAHNKARKSLDVVYKKAVKEGWIAEGATITIRDGRMVLPIQSEFKRRIKGFVHDESSTGQTVYLEPAEVLESNNEIRELEYAEKREVVKILTTLTDMIRENNELLSDGYKYLGLIDFIRAKARFAKDLEAIMPHFTADPIIKWNNARHPLLYLSYQESERHVVPLNIQINDKDRILVISGPNAGGKSVCLKTVGLVQYMLQCGFLVPLEEGSEVGIFSDMFIDIGDEQSLENDLSTYSSHLTNMKALIKNVNRSSLFLIDEFGTGTDPQFGGAIAEAILDKLAASAGKGVVTTHYSNIKLYAESQLHILNGAMKFDMKELEPLYELEIGKPGSSFSLEIARKIGLSKEVVRYAQGIIGGKNIDVDDLILKLDKQEQEIKKRVEEIRDKEKEVNSLRKQYDQLYQELDENKKKIINKAKSEAEDLLRKTNREIEKTIRHIKENRAEKKETRKIRDRLTSLKEQVKTERKPEKDDKVVVVAGDIKVGDSVRLVDNQVIGQVLDIRGKDVEVQVGDLKTMVKLKRLEKISKGEAKRVTRQSKSGSGFDISAKRANFSTTLDIRGKRAEEVLSLIDRFIDDAVLFNIPEVKILHGKGNGVLRDVVRNSLKGIPHITSIMDEHVERGGAGITVITLE